MINRASLAVSPDIMKEVEKRDTQRLPAPGRATVKGVGQKQVKTWIEEFTIDDIAVTEDEKHQGTVVYFVRMKVADDSAEPENVGLSHAEWYRVDYPALKNPDPKFGRRIMGELALQKLKQIVRAAGEEIEQGVEFQPYDYFVGEDGVQPLLLGRRVVARVREKQKEDQDGVVKPQTEVIRFTSPDEISSL